MGQTKRQNALQTNKHFDLYWSPEGRKIACVDAKDERAAIRKAPQPYRKFLGEIYAVETVCTTEINATDRRY